MLRSVGVKIGAIGPNACYFSTSKELIGKALYLDLEDVTQSVSRKKKGTKWRVGREESPSPFIRSYWVHHFPVAKSDLWPTVLSKEQRGYQKI